MKLFFLCLAVIFSGHLFAQQEFSLSEQDSKKMILSGEFQTMISFQNQFLDAVDNAVKKGTQLPEIEKLALDAAKGNATAFYTVLFGNERAGAVFFNNYSSAKRSLVNSSPDTRNHPEVFVCKTCYSSQEDQVRFFFKNFNTFNKYRYTGKVDLSSDGKAVPTCGSYWNQFKLLACAAACGASTAGIGAAVCGWGCWCTFCSQHSSAASVICAN